MLDRLTVDDFAPLVGRSFALRTDQDAGSLELELVSARLYDHEQPAVDADGKRAPFALVLVGPPDPVLPQRVYALEQEAFGTLEVFMVPIGRDGQGTSYEVIFN